MRSWTPTAGPRLRSISREAVRDLVGEVACGCRPPPVLLLSRNDAYQCLNKFIVTEVTTTIRAIPRSGGIRHPRRANVDLVANSKTAAYVERHFLEPVPKHCRRAVLAKYF